MKCKFSRDEIEDLIDILDSHPTDSDHLTKTVPNLRRKLHKKLRYSDGNSGKEFFLEQHRKERELREKYGKIE